MDIMVHTEGFSVTESIRAAVQEKIGRVAQYAPHAIRARVRLRRVSVHPSPKQYSVSVLCEIPGNDLRAEESGPGPMSALDILAEKIEARLRKRKTSHLAKRDDNEGACHPRSRRCRF